MSAAGAASAPGSSGSDGAAGPGGDGSAAELVPPVVNQTVPDELLLGLSSSVGPRSSQGPGTHQRPSKGCGLRRPDAVWHHSLGRKKYKFFLEQPACLSGAGRDISFLCDAVGPQKKTTPLPLPPLADRSSSASREVGLGPDQTGTWGSGSSPSEEYRVVKNKGLKSLELYEDAFTVQLQDDERKLHVFPSLRPSGRLEVLQLMEKMDNMVLEAGLDRRGEPLTELSQMESLLEAVQAEQNIYNTVFHELIRQVTVSCAERGQLLAKLRQRYQSLLERIPRCVKALHTEAVAQRVLNHRLAQEMSRIRTSFQQLSAALSTIREHHHLASQEADQAHQHLAGAVEQARSSSDVVQGYHELYQLHRSRLETQLLRTTEERDCWIQLTFALANKIISTKKLHTIKRLHVSEQSWFEAAEHCCLYLSSKDSQDLEVIVELGDRWKEQLRAFVSQLKSTEHLQRERLSVVHQGTIKWLSFCNTQNKCGDPKYDITTLESITADLQQWVNMLVLHCECYQGEKLLGCQEQLAELHRVQKTSLSLGLQLLKRHPSPDGELPGGRRALSELDAVLSELLHQLDARVSGDNGTYRPGASLLGLVEAWLPKLGAAIRRPEAVSTSDWLSLEEALLNWQGLLETLLQNFCTRPEEMMDTSAETDKVLQKMQDCMSSLSNLTDGENQRLSEEVSSLHMAQTRWMLNLLLLVVPDHSEVPDQELGERCSKDVSPRTLEEDAKSLSEKLESLSSSIRSSCELVLEEGALQHPDGAEKERNELGKLQTEASEWVETCRILLSGLKQGPGGQDGAQTPSDGVPGPPADTLRNKGGSNEPIAENPGEGETEAKVEEEELKDGETLVVKMIDCDGNVTQRRLGEAQVHLSGTEDWVVSPVTEEAQKAFQDLSTVRFLQQELVESERRVQRAERRTLKAEEALQSASVQIGDLERKLQGPPRLSAEELGETPAPPIPAASAPGEDRG